MSFPIEETLVTEESNNHVIEDLKKYDPLFSNFSKNQIIKYIDDEDPTKNYVITIDGDIITKENDKTKVIMDIKPYFKHWKPLNGFLIDNSRYTTNWKVILDYAIQFDSIIEIEKK